MMHIAWHSLERALTWVTSTAIVQVLEVKEYLEHQITSNITGGGGGGGGVGKLLLFPKLVYSSGYMPAVVTSPADGIGETLWQTSTATTTKLQSFIMVCTTLIEPVYMCTCMQSTS